MSTKKMVWAVMGLAIILAACAPAATAVPAPVPTTPPIVITSAPVMVPAPTATTSYMDTLAAACKKEGSITLIADPPDWANYGTLMQTFGSRYGVSVNDLNPNGSSAEELAAIKANEATRVPRLPTRSTSATPMVR